PVSAHRIRNPWSEDSVTWNERQAGTNWDTAGSDFDITAVATTPVGPTNKRYEWNITSLAQGWVDGVYPNHGFALVAAVAGMPGERFYTSDEADRSRWPSLSITYTCQCGTACIAPQGSGNLLMVVVNPTTLVAEDQQAKDLFESWGYTVSVISESANQASYDTAVANNDVVFISETVNSNSVGTKLADAPIGVVSQDGDYNPSLGFASGSALKVGAAINVTDNSHYITRVFALGALEIYAADMEILTVAGTEASGLQTLGDIGGDGNLVLLDVGDDAGGDIVGETAKGRRVMLPLGTRYRFDWDHLNANGRLLVQRALEWGMNKKGPAGAVPGIWVSTLGDVSGSGAPGLDAWTDGEAISFEDPNLLLEPGPTAGTFVSHINLDDFAGDADIDAIHYVSTDMTVGGGANTVDLIQGDLLLSTAADETLTSSNTLSVKDNDVFVFRPDAADDYASGTFIYLLDGEQIDGNPIVAISLVEKDTAVGDALVPAGAFLYNTTNRRDVQLFLPTGVGAGTTSGAISELVDGPDVNLGSEIRGLDLVENSYTLGGHLIPAGSILMTLNADGSNSGDNGVPTDSEDIFYLTMTQTGANSVGDATLLFDGSDVNLDTSNEHLQALTLRPPSGGFPILPPQLLFIVADPTGLTAQETSRKDLMESWGYTVKLIDDGASQTEINDSAAAADAVYVSGNIGGGALADKLTDSPAHIVNEFYGKLDNFGFSSSTGSTVTADGFATTNPAHYISETFSGAPAMVFTAALTMSVPGGTLAPDLQVAGETAGATAALVTLDAGATRWDSRPSPGRRVHLPFANAAAADLHADGEVLIRRAIEWAGGAEIDLSPIAHWKLDETAGFTAVDSEGGHDGTLTNYSAPAWTAGVVDGGLDFDGSNDYVDAGSFDVVGSGITMMAWFNAEAIATDDGRFVSKASSPNEVDAYWQLSTTDSGSNRYLRMRIKAGSTTTTLADSSFNLATGTWYLATATYDNASGMMRLYLDGVEVASTAHAVGGALDTNPAVPVALGANGTAERFFNGILDDVRIYNRALGATEISDLYDAGAPALPGYTELYEPWVAATPDTWETISLASMGVPANAVVEVAVINEGISAQRWGG
ncbi:MAG: DNRLRE domain-containing protein, partial [Alphaproteobacteria bacterium]|nr:DNRLRE domain-containing protein [Alphaproteobacteria bacterium]